MATYEVKISVIAPVSCDDAIRVRLVNFKTIFPVRQRAELAATSREQRIVCIEVRASSIASARKIGLRRIRNALQPVIAANPHAQRTFEIIPLPYYQPRRITQPVSHS